LRVKEHAEFSRQVARDCAAHGAKYFDFRELSSFSGERNEFWDPVHLTPTNLRKLTNILFGQPAERIFPELPTDAERLRRLNLLPAEKKKEKRAE
jgi:hypothetical protein